MSAAHLAIRSRQVRAANSRCAAPRPEGPPPHLPGSCSVVLVDQWRSQERGRTAPRAPIPVHRALADGSSDERYGRSRVPSLDPPRWFAIRAGPYGCPPRLALPDSTNSHGVRPNPAATERHPSRRTEPAGIETRILQFASALYLGLRRRSRSSSARIRRMGRGREKPHSTRPMAGRERPPDSRRLRKTSRPWLGHLRCRTSREAGEVRTTAQESRSQHLGQAGVDPRCSAVARARSAVRSSCRHVRRT